MTFKAFLKENYYKLLDNLPKDPLPYFGIGFTVGILSYFSDFISIQIIIAITAIIILLVKFIRKHLIIYIIFLLTLSFLFGFIITYYHREYSYPNKALEDRVYNKEYKAKLLKIMDRGKKSFFYLKIQDHNEGINYLRLKSPKNANDFFPDDILKIKVNLYPPPKPYFKGDYDFAFYAKTHHIQAVGNIKTIELIKRPYFSFDRLIQKTRKYLEKNLRENLFTNHAAIASAMITGNRSLLAEETNILWKEAGIFHLLSISGLHMTVIAGLIFFTCRKLLFIFPPLIRQYDTKKLSALIAIFFAYLYTLLSGESIPAFRAFITVTVILSAVLLDRRVISIRNAIIAYIIILTLNPAQIYHIGFGLSFAAVLGILLAADIIRELRNNDIHNLKSTSLLNKIAIFIIINLCASYAGTPLSVYAFGSVPIYGFAANIFAVPFTGTILMPALTLSVLLMPFDLEFIPLSIATYSFQAIEYWAMIIKGIDGNIQSFTPPTKEQIILFYLGIYLMVILQKRSRFIGVIPIICAYLLYIYMPIKDIIYLNNKHTIAILDDNKNLRIITNNMKFKPSSYLHERLARSFGISPKSDYYISYCDRKYLKWKRYSDKWIKCSMLTGDLY